MLKTLQFKVEHIMSREYLYMELAFVWIVILATSLPISSLYPFLYHMIEDFGVAEDRERQGALGFFGCSFMLGRALTSVLWGVVADRYGRKPIILLGTFTIYLHYGLTVQGSMEVQLFTMMIHIYMKQYCLRMALEVGRARRSSGIYTFEGHLAINYTKREYNISNVTFQIERQ